MSNLPVHICVLLKLHILSLKKPKGNHHTIAIIPQGLIAHACGNIQRTPGFLRLWIGRCLPGCTLAASAWGPARTRRLVPAPAPEPSAAHQNNRLRSESDKPNYSHPKGYGRKPMMCTWRRQQSYRLTKPRRPKPRSPSRLSLFRSRRHRRTVRVSGPHHRIAIRGNLGNQRLDLQVNARGQKPNNAIG